MNRELKAAIFFATLALCVVVFGVVANATEMGDVDPRYQQEADLADLAIRDMTIDLTPHQEYLLFTILTHIRNADQYRADANIRTGMVRTLKELLRQKIMTQSELIVFTETAVDYQQEIAKDE